MTISQRAELEGTTVEVTCIGRFFDLFLTSDPAVEGSPTEWKLVRRQPIYERDRMDPVIAYTALKGSMSARTSRFAMGPLANLYAQGDRWLAGARIPDILG